MSAYFDAFHFEDFTEGVNKTAPLVFDIQSNNKYFKDLSDLKFVIYEKVTKG